MYHTRHFPCQGELTGESKYEYSRIPYEDDLAVRLQDEADLARDRAIEAERKVHEASLAIAEEAFLLEAANAAVRLEAFRLQQRLQQRLLAKKQRAQDDGKREVDARRGAEQELKEGWVNVKRRGGGMQRRVYVLRRTAILTFADESRKEGYPF